MLLHPHEENRLFIEYHDVRHAVRAKKYFDKECAGVKAAFIDKHEVSWQITKTSSVDASPKQKLTWQHQQRLSTVRSSGVRAIPPKNVIDLDSIENGERFSNLVIFFWVRFLALNRLHYKATNVVQRSWYEIFPTSTPR
jgi:hypothetical protein